MPYTLGMGMIKELLTMMRQDRCDGCCKLLTECHRECQAAADEEAAWLRDIK